MKKKIIGLGLILIFLLGTTVKEGILGEEYTTEKYTTEEIYKIQQDPVRLKKLNEEREKMGLPPLGLIVPPKKEVPTKIEKKEEEKYQYPRRDPIWGKLIPAERPRLTYQDAIKVSLEYKINSLSAAPLIWGYPRNSSEEAQWKWKKEDLKKAGYTEEEIKAIEITAPLFFVTDEEEREICIEAAKWALAKTLQLAERFSRYRYSAKKILSSGIKEELNWEDVDFALWNGMSMAPDGSYGCGHWVSDCLAYGYLKAKEEDLRKAAKVWGYDFEVFKKLLGFSINDWYYPAELISSVPPLAPIGAVIKFSNLWVEVDELGRKRSIGHSQLSLGRWGYTTNGKFIPDVNDAYVFPDKEGNLRRGEWTLPAFKNPIVATAFWKVHSDGLASVGKWSDEIQNGLFHLPQNRKYQPKYVKIFLQKINL